MRTFFEDYYASLNETIQMNEESCINFVHDVGGLHTHINNQQGQFVGFFTPFNELVNVPDGSNRMKPAGIKEAAIATAVLPTIQLVQAIAFTALIPYKLVESIIAAVRGDLENAEAYFGQFLLVIPSSIYCYGGFVFNLLKELTALVTRSVATLVDTFRTKEAPAVESAVKKKDDPFAVWRLDSGHEYNGPDIVGARIRIDGKEEVDVFHTPG